MPGWFVAFDYRRLIRTVTVIAIAVATATVSLMVKHQTASFPSSCRIGRSGAIRTGLRLGAYWIAGILADYKLLSWQQRRLVQPHYSSSGRQAHCSRRAARALDTDLDRALISRIGRRRWIHREIDQVDAA